MGGIIGPGSLLITMQIDAFACINCQGICQRDFNLLSEAIVPIIKTAQVCLSLREIYT